MRAAQLGDACMGPGWLWRVGGEGVLWWLQQLPATLTCQRSAWCDAAGMSPFRAWRYLLLCTPRGCAMLHARPGLVMHGVQSQGKKSQRMVRGCAPVWVCDRAERAAWDPNCIRGCTASACICCGHSMHLIALGMSLHYQL